MSEIAQGLVLMLAGMGIVFAFLLVLIGVTLVTMKGLAKFDYIFPKEAPKKAPQKAAANDDENIALAIAVAMNG